ncbi:outer membrane protein OmpA-like peptidoglycan-associated protein [Natronocella acetinitrilica]|uniref:Outer membrane protein OmpA-like peptidoglycan-associated protein n=1 Tax=Natronocella acetinitrilica TaxID=414046 RepID=A0AAE3G4W8_9GAMM|nr:OmpA family protein [Natronocella acetinitrilica]MCP1675203.1 outer membrane protein OmpA-like peptidoglycan-associated protein [Natronocella acetinitrilica]
MPFVRTAVFTLAATVVLAACTTTDPYTGEERTSRATYGAAIGAVAGAVIGGVTGSNSRERRNRALIGAGVGGLSGAAVGGYMDRQEARLRDQLRGTGVSVTRQGDDIILNMPGNVTFGFDSADLRSDFFEVLDSVALVVNEFDQTLIEAAGHTDSTGSAAYNQRLSERRADTVARYLQNRGVDSRRIAAAGFGQDYPIADNSTEAGRQANRRVELTLVPLRQ